MMGWVLDRKVGEEMGWRIGGRWMPFAARFGPASPTTVADNTPIAVRGSVAMLGYFGRGRK